MMEKDTFKFHVQELSYGWCRVVMQINDKEIHYNASYLGINPLESLIDACAYLQNEGKTYHAQWMEEPGMLCVSLELKENNKLFIDIQDKDEDDNTILQEWHEVVPFECFVSAVVAEGFRMLEIYGLCGYRCSWHDNTDFPLTNLLRISADIKETWKGDSCCTDIAKEMEHIQKHLK